MNVKYFVLGLLLCIGAALAFDINSPNPIQFVDQGDVADYTVTFVGYDNISLTVSSDLSVSLSERNFAVNGRKDIHVLVLTEDNEVGFYPITLTARGNNQTYTYSLGTGIKEGEAYLLFDALYNKVEVVQGEDVELRFIVRNVNDQMARNIVIKGDIYESFKPEYPGPVTVSANDVEEVSVKLHVTNDMPAQDYPFTVTAAFGNAEYTQEVDVVVKNKATAKNALALTVSDSWEPLENTDGEAIGYKVFLTVENKQPIDLSGVEVVFEGLPAGWKFSGDTKFDITPLSTKKLTVNIEPKDKDFAEVNAVVKLVDGTQEITQQDIKFAGYKVGTTTGSFLLGGSLTIGLLIVVVIALVLLYIRQKNQYAETVNEDQTKKYLKDLVEKTAKETKKK